MRIYYNGPSCPRCHGKGFFQVRLKEDFETTYYTALFKCDCKIGGQIHKSWPVWKESLLSKYDVDFESLSGEQLKLNESKPNIQSP